MNKLVLFWVKTKRVARLFGPGLITGASDDDPSGIATYSQAGAGFGYATLWTAMFTFPLMAAVQGMCGRIGLVTGHGLAGTLRRHYHKGFLYLMLLLSFPAITFNIGADIQGMGAVSNMLFPAIPVWAFCIFFTAFLLWVIIKYSFERISLLLKWLCLSLLLYIIIPFLVSADIASILKSTFIPTIRFDRDFFAILVAILGTTISPYLFFWQATMEAEAISHQNEKSKPLKHLLKDMRLDVNFGMLFSNLVMFFIILTTGEVLNKSGITQIETVDQAAKALEPLTGGLSYHFFAIGVIGTGLLAIPVFASSLAYILAETFDWSQGLDKKFFEARGFYVTLSASLIIGLGLDFLGFSPIKALLYTAILYGLTAPVLIGAVLLIGNNIKIMGAFTNSRLSNVLGLITLVVMMAAAAGLVYFQLK
ncbi:MAG TPA: divalent metal cation transporter [Cyclobacteriaceae bacterium]|nr:divalent metal cation transporter [Cyclobacteriaceae bacterium]